MTGVTRQKTGELTCMDDVQLYRVHVYRNHPHCRNALKDINETWYASYDKSVTHKLKRTDNTNSTKNREWFQVLRKSRQVLPYISILKTGYNPWQEDGWKWVIYRIPGTRRVIENSRVRGHISANSWPVWPAKETGELTWMDDVQLYRVHVYRNHPHGLSGVLPIVRRTISPTAH
jgi:hypothetical protein